MTKEASTPKTSRERTAAAPWHFWAVAFVSLLWNAVGVYDYLMTHIADPRYLAQFTAEQRAYFDALPPLQVAFWALGVWGSLAGSLLLLVKSRRAVTAFWVSLVGLAVSTVFQQSGALPESLRTPGMIGMTVVIWAALLFFLWYAHQMRRRGTLV
jgi:hypothetical protein